MNEERFDLLTRTAKDANNINLPTSGMLENYKIRESKYNERIAKLQNRQKDSQSIEEARM